MPSDAYVHDVLEGLRRDGIEASECPVCLDVPEEAVLTACAHVMCRACLLNAMKYYSSHALPRVPRRRRREGRQGARAAAREADAGAPTLQELRDEWRASSKCDKVMEELRAALKEDGRKVIIFSQFTSMLDLLELPLRAELAAAGSRARGALRRRDVAEAPRGGARAPL